MKKTVAVIGNSQLAFFVAKQLDRYFGEHAHMEIIWITSTGKLFTATKEKVDCKRYLENVSVINSAVKSITLRDSRIITGKRTIEYDVAFIDQTPVYTAAERDNIIDQFETLVATVRSNENRGVVSKAKMAFVDNDFDSLDIALSLNDRKNRDSSASVANIRVEVGSATGNVATFLRERGVYTRKSQYPGVVLKKPLPMISSKKIRGLGVDLSGKAMTLATLEAANYQNVLVIDNPDRQSQNIARSDWQLAKAIVENIRAKIEGGLEKPIECDGNKLLLKSNSGQFVSLGSMSSSRNRARAVYALDKRFWRGLLR